LVGLPQGMFEKCEKEQVRIAKKREGGRGGGWQNFSKIASFLKIRTCSKRKINLQLYFPSCVKKVFVMSKIVALTKDIMVNFLLAYNNGQNS
jgi:hypothetical protein